MPGLACTKDLGGVIHAHLHTSLTIRVTAAFLLLSFSPATWDLKVFHNMFNKIFGITNPDVLSGLLFYIPMSLVHTHIVDHTLLSIHDNI